MKECILIVDLGSQYTQLIARRVREVGVYCEVIRYDTPWRRIASEIGVAYDLKGIILSGGPSSVYDKFSPSVHPEFFNLGIPILGICYGMQLMMDYFGGKVRPSKIREYGKTSLSIKPSLLFDQIIASHTPVWMSHGDEVVTLPDGFKLIASTNNINFAGVENHPFYAIQFHPEVYHTARGLKMFENFVRKICNCKQKYEVSSFIEDQVKNIRNKVGPDDIVICGLSGGVDSSVAAALVKRAIGDQQRCIFIDHGLLRKDEQEEIKKAFNSLHISDEKHRFLRALVGVTDPEEKRKIIGREFIESFKDAVRKFDTVTNWDLYDECSSCHWEGNIEDRPGCICTKTSSIAKKKFLVQGTLYPDVIESKSVFSELTDVIKSHHNVGGLPEELGFELIEPLKMLFKDEVRELGKILGISDKIIQRQPFPGPGLAIRIVGEVTERRLDIVRQADAIVREEIESYPVFTAMKQRPWQYYAALLPVRSVGVMGDKRTYEETIVVRAVSSVDGMTADFSDLPHKLLGKISNRIVNEVSGVNRVVYDITSKPPGTIEWE